MPIIKSASKRVRQANKRRLLNKTTKLNYRAAVKAFLAKPTTKTMSEAQSTLDTAVKKNVLTKATAARRKAKLAKVGKEAGVKLSTSAATKKPAAKATTAKSSAAKKPAAKTTATKKTTAKATATKKPATTKKAAASKSTTAKKPAAKKTTTTKK